MKLLVFHDDPAYVRLISGVLQPEGFRLLYQQDPDSVVELARRARPDGALIDVADGKGEGAGLLASLRALEGGPHLVLLAFSGQLEPWDPVIRRMVERHALDAFLRKPFNLLDLPTLLRQARRHPAGERLLRPAKPGPGPATRRPSSGSPPPARGRHRPAVVRSRERPFGEVPSGRPEGASSPVHPDDVDRLRRTLRRDLKNIRHADDWTALSIPRGSDPALVRRAARRMQARYREILANPRWPEDVKDLAARILERVEQAGRAVVGHDAVASPEPGREDFEAIAFRQGREALAAERYAQAVRCFTAARRERPDSARNLAWLGWAIYRDPDRPRAQRTQEALQLLRLADAFDPSLPEGQVFLARVEADVDEVTRAIARLRRLLREFPDHRRARELLKRLERIQAEQEAREAEAAGEASTAPDADPPRLKVIT